MKGRMDRLITIHQHLCIYTEKLQWTVTVSLLNNGLYNSLQTMNFNPTIFYHTFSTMQLPKSADPGKDSHGPATMGNPWLPL